MGEYAMYRGQRIKIGCDTELLDLRFEDRFKVRVLAGNIDPVRDAHDCSFRVPLPDEDQHDIGEYTGRGYALLYQYDAQGRADYYSPESLEPAGTVQARTEHGVTVNITCYHGTTLPAPGGDIIKTFWNGRAPHLALHAIRCRYRDDDTTALMLSPVVRCLACRERWDMTWDELLPYVHGPLKQRLMGYAQWNGLETGPTMTPATREES